LSTSQGHLIAPNHALTNHLSTANCSQAKWMPTQWHFRSKNAR